MKKPTYEELQGLVRSMVWVMKRISQPGTDIEEVQALVSGFVTLDQKVSLDKDAPVRRIELELPADTPAAGHQGRGTWEEQANGSLKLTLAIPQSLAQLAAAEEIYVEALEDLYRAISDMMAEDEELSKETYEAHRNVESAFAQLSRYRNGEG